MNIVLISTYELGRQPFGVASPAAWLRKGGYRVASLDLSRQPLDEAAVREAGLIAMYLPMHTATRLATQLIPALRKLNPTAHFCCYGLYAPMNTDYLRTLGVSTILGGEFEQGLAHLAERLGGNGNGNGALSRSQPEQQPEPLISLARQKFVLPDRQGLAPLAKYARVILPSGEHRVAGYTEASRGCKHLCRHCPIVPVYQGVFRVVDQEVVLQDIRQQIAAGAQHITFGDPDFFNGIGHAMAIVEALHQEFPALTYDVTIKIEHLLKHKQHLARLRDTGCLFVTSAVESVDDELLCRLAKGHTRADFLEVNRIFRELGMVLHPTFVPFTPWTTLETYLYLLRVLRENDLVENLAPVQLAIRLLIPAGSRLLELEEVRHLIGAFDPSALVYPWRNPDPRVDALAEELEATVAICEKLRLPRRAIFERIWKAAHQAAGVHAKFSAQPILADRATIPYLNEPWYC
ncbi:MAG: radical SAM protein [Acidobacteria bacterium]|nr:MAG: radical SAM protein [Acidobacteriota bacterium]